MINVTVERKWSRWWTKTCYNHRVWQAEVAVSVRRILLTSFISTELFSPLHCSAAGPAFKMYAMLIINC